MNCIFVRIFFCVIPHSWLNNPFMVFGLHEYRPICRFEASAVKAMRPILTREFSFQLIFGFRTLLRSQYWKYHIPIRLLSLLHCDVYHGVEVDILEDESLEKCLLHVCHPGNYSPNSVLSKDPFLFCSWTLFSDVIDIGLLLPPLLPLLLFEEARFYPHREGNGFPMHAGRCDLRFNIVRILRTLLVIFPRSAWKIRNTDYRSSSFSRNDEP